jgi:hypothetical protein
MRYAKVHRISDNDAARLKQLTVTFVSQWHSYTTLVKMGLIPSGDGLPSDIEALDYVIYEHLYSMFAVDETAFIEIATAVFGKTLARLLHFKWCYIELPSGPALGLSHPETNVRVPLQALIATKLSGLPQFGTFEELFFDIYCMQSTWPDGHHPLVECNWTTAEDIFFKTWGFEVPASIKERFFLLILQDEHLAVRRFGLLAYDWITTPNWSQIENQLSIIESNFADLFGSDWPDRVRTEYAHLFA